MCVEFCVTNFLFTWLTHLLGPSFYGYGFAVSTMVTSLTGLVLLTGVFRDLSHHTFMHQPGPADAG